MRSIVYHQFHKELHIIKAKRFVYHHCERLFDTHLRCDEIQRREPPLMIYTLTRDDMPLLSQWIKKSRSEERDFLAAELGFEPRQTESESAVLPLHNSASMNAYLKA